MGNLLKFRVQQCRLILHSGIDYAGQLYLSILRAQRGNRGYFEGYITIFVCMGSRAVHLEASSDYSRKNFLLVLKRFAAQRGIPATLSSDCGTNFVGADKELRDLFAKAKSQKSEISYFLVNKRKVWRFNH